MITVETCAHLLQLCCHLLLIPLSKLGLPILRPIVKHQLITSCNVCHSNHCQVQLLRCSVQHWHKRTVALQHACHTPLPIAADGKLLLLLLLLEVDVLSWDGVQASCCVLLTASAKLLLLLLLRCCV
jgi:hypothetical protein